MKFRPIRWFLLLTLAAVLTALPTVGPVLLGNSSNKVVTLTAWLFGTSWAMWLVATTALGAISFRRGRASPVAYTVLGALLAYVFPLAAIAVVRGVLPGIMPDMPRLDRWTETVVAALKGGIFSIPFGLLAGWMFWRIVARFPTGDLEPMAPQQYRRWQNVWKPRLAIAVMLAAAIPGIVVVVIATLAGGSDTLAVLTLPGFGAVMLVLEIWFFALGLPYFYLLGQRRGSIRRRDCLVLGTLLSCFFFPVLAAAWGLIPGMHLDESDTLVVFMTAVWLSIIFIPIGLFCGWVLWRIGVRPTPLLDLPVVFD
jgi:hypothetical protein